MPETRQFSIRMDAKLHAEFKKLCVDENKTMTEYVVELIRKEVEEKRQEQ